MNLSTFILCAFMAATATAAPAFHYFYTSMHPDTTDEFTSSRNEDVNMPYNYNNMLYHHHGYNLMQQQQFINNPYQYGNYFYYQPALIYSSCRNNLGMAVPCAGDVGQPQAWIPQQVAPPANQRYPGGGAALAQQQQQQQPFQAAQAPQAPAKAPTSENFDDVVVVGEK